ncbi:MAG: hypothetical protein PHH37_01600 [Paludibacter sp.]|nr:hypothetical protein [Paludibacter sp.]
MKSYSITDLWCFIEEKTDDDLLFESEAFFETGNGHLKQQANFEEFYSGKTVRGSFVEGIDYEDPNLQKAWKEPFNPDLKQIINSPDWTPVIVRLNDEVLDLKTWEIINYKRTFNMHEACIERTFEAISPKAHHISVTIKRILCLAEPEIAAISYCVKSLNFEGRISFMPLVQGNLQNEPGLANELQWNVLQTRTLQETAHLWIQIKHIKFQTATAIAYNFYKNNEQLNLIPTKIEKEKTAGFSIGTDVRTGDTLCLNKFIAVVTSAQYPSLEITEKACSKASEAKAKGWNRLYDEHRTTWEQKWFYTDFQDGDYSEKSHLKKYKYFRDIFTK